MSGPGRGRTCASPGKSRELCRLSYGAKSNVAGRSRTCDAPRFRRALYRLSFSHMCEGDEVGRVQIELARERLRSVRATEICARRTRSCAKVGEAGLEPANLLFVRQALYAIELLALVISRGDLNPHGLPPTALSTPRVYRSATWM